MRQKMVPGNLPGTRDFLIRIRWKQLPLGRPGGDLDPGMEPELLEDPGIMVFGGALGDREL